MKGDKDGLKKKKKLKKKDKANIQLKEKKKRKLKPLVGATADHDDEDGGDDECSATRCLKPTGKSLEPTLLMEVRWEIYTFHDLAAFCLTLAGQNATETWNLHWDEVIHWPIPEEKQADDYSI